MDDLKVDPLRRIAELADAIAETYPKAVEEFSNRMGELERAEADLPKAIDAHDVTRLQLRVSKKHIYAQQQLALCKAWWGKVEDLRVLTGQHLPSFSLWYVSQPIAWHLAAKFNWPGATRELRSIAEKSWAAKDAVTTIPNRNCSVDQLCEQLDMSGDTLNKFTKLAQVSTAKRGERNHRFSGSDRLKILNTVADKSPTKKHREAAARLLGNPK